MSVGYMIFGVLAGICLIVGIVVIGVIIKKKRKSFEANEFGSVSELEWIEDNG